MKFTLKKLLEELNIYYWFLLVLQLVTNFHPEQFPVL